ncbi:Dihydrofolate synthase @ Folylpolyglutamate synthase [hydrothermal vent metagenome]|uniref:Dihydrofolate synthase @ Folylpolyglutamate synthase n=1 Tax=hydrothermal vent metagenome TaxID=652676 RepID=A0A3B0T668_9ZZZZ
MSFHEIDQYLNTFINHENSLNEFSEKDINLNRVCALLQLLGNPQDNLFIVHVAGSKGKGSICAMTASILKEAGYRVGLYTSPHLNHHSERIRVLDKKGLCASEGIFADAISFEDLLGVLEKIKPHIESLLTKEDLGPYSFFEIYTVAAIVYFSQQKVDCVILEAGLGGRLDATNVFDSQIAVVTPISLEHINVLGSTIEKIAREKAAIIKSKNQKVVFSPQEEVVKNVLEERCRLFDIHPIWAQAEDFSAISLALKGAHQNQNASVSVAIVKVLREKGFTIQSLDVCKGLESVYWPVRFEKIKSHPEFILDGAHNRSSTRELVKTFKKYYPDRQATVVLGFSSDKDGRSICEELKPIAKKVVLTKANHPRAKEIEMKLVEDIFSNVLCLQTKSVAQALSLIKEEKDMVLVTGSMFVASEMRRLCLN